MTTTAGANAASTNTTVTSAPPSGGRRRRRGGIYAPIPRRHYGIIVVVSLAVILGIWTLSSSPGWVNPLFLPTLKVWDSFRLWSSDGTLWQDTRDSITRIMLGFLVSSLVAVPVGILMGTYKRTEAAVEPIVGFIRYMPAVAFIPLTLIWFGTTESQKIVILFIGVFFQEVLLVMDNVKTVPRQFIEMGYTLGLSQIAVLWRVVVRYSLPGIVDTLRICMGWAWTYLVVAELVGAQTGLGFRIQTAQRYLDTPLILAGIIWIGVLGLAFDYGFKLLYIKAFPYLRRGR